MFSRHVSEQLGYYVYRLIDPRNGETFYVGKGKNNRVFDHAKGKTDDKGEDRITSKLDRIRAIQIASFEVQHVIHRHGLDERTAESIEAALIDAYPGLTNLVIGKKSRAVGVMHANEIIELYEAEMLVIKHKLLMITINRTAASESIYEAVRYAWKLDKKKAEEAEYVLAVLEGLVVGVFVATEWLVASSENFEHRADRSPRIGFRGVEAPEQVQNQYLRRRVPNEFRRPGMANPVKYAFPV